MTNESLVITPGKDFQSKYLESEAPLMINFYCI